VGDIFVHREHANQTAKKEAFVRFPAREPHEISPRAEGCGLAPQFGGGRVTGQITKKPRQPARRRGRGGRITPA